MVSILFDLLSSRKISTTPFKSLKNIYLNSSAKDIKEAQFYVDFKKVHNYCIKKCCSAHPERIGLIGKPPIPP